MIDTPKNPKADDPLDLLTADLMAQIHELGRNKFDIQGTHTVVTFCRKEFKCELHEITIAAAKWMIAQLSQLPDKPKRVLPPRADDVIAPPPVRIDTSMWGPKL